MTRLLTVYLVVEAVTDGAEAIALAGRATALLRVKAGPTSAGRTHDRIQLQHRRTPNATILSEAFPLYQRNLVTDATGWLRQIEAKAKQLKNGKVVLIAVIQPG